MCIEDVKLCALKTIKSVEWKANMQSSTNSSDDSVVFNLFHILCKINIIVLLYKE